MSATCLKTSSPPALRAPAFSSPSFSMHARIYEEDCRVGGWLGDGRPDPLIARHSCPFVRHLIASRGSRGILRGGYLYPPPGLFECQVRGSWHRCLLDTSRCSHLFATSPRLARTFLVSLVVALGGQLPATLDFEWFSRTYLLENTTRSTVPRERRRVDRQRCNLQT